MGKLLMTTAVAALLVSATGPPAQAGETDYTGLVACGHYTVSILTAGPDVSAFSNEWWAIVPPNNPVKALENATLHCKYFTHVSQGKPTSLGACSWTDAQGDTLIGETRMEPDKAPVWTFLSGTGKWKGITGTGTWAPASAGKPAPDGSVEICVDMSGKWTLP